VSTLTANTIHKFWQVAKPKVSWVEPKITVWIQSLGSCDRRKMILYLFPHWRNKRRLVGVTKRLVSVIETTFLTREGEIESYLCTVYQTGSKKWCHFSGKQVVECDHLWVESQDSAVKRNGPPWELTTRRLNRQGYHSYQLRFTGTKTRRHAKSHKVINIRSTWKQNVRNLIPSSHISNGQATTHVIQNQSTW
jgi:hypothetical protein